MSFADEQLDQFCAWVITRLQNKVAVGLIISKPLQEIAGRDTLNGSNNTVWENCPPFIFGLVFWRRLLNRCPRHDLKAVLKKCCKGVNRFQMTWTISQWVFR